METSRRTERVLSEAQVDFEHRFRALAECSADAIFVTEFDSAKFIEVNSGATELFGYRAEELCGMTGRQLHPAEDAPVVDEISRELIDKGHVHRRAVRLRKKTGETFWAELRSSAYFFRSRKLYVTIVRDVSAHLSREKDLEEAYRSLKESEAYLIRSSRLAAIGHLAAGVAHEVNNPAASALSNLQLLEQGLERLATHARHEQSLESLRASVAAFVAEASEGVRDSLEGIQRIAFTVKGLRGFVRIDQDDVELVDLNEVARAGCNLARHQVRHSAQVQCDLRASDRLPGSRGRLVQVVLNLLLNAAHAIEQGGGGLIRVSTASTSDGVLLSVEDDGPGVRPEIAERIFEPFFTTKAADRGTGLGLSVCAEIVRGHRGTLRLQKSELGGARFDVALPLHTGLTPTPRAESQPPVSERPLRILLIDDEPTLIRSYRRLLGRSHEVVGVGDGAQALSILEADSDFDLILCDLMMPGLDGVAIYEALRERQPELLERLVFSSGGPTSARAQSLLSQPGVILLEKPITNDKLVKFIAHRSRVPRLRHGGAASTDAETGPVGSSGDT